MRKKVTRIDAFTGFDEKTHRRIPLGREEQLLEAGLSALAKQNPFGETRVVRVFNPIPGKYEFRDFDIAVPYFIATFGVDPSEQAAASTGFVLFKVSEVRPTTRCYYRMEWLKRKTNWSSLPAMQELVPTVTVRGDDGRWHRYNGAIVLKSLSRRIHREMIRREITPLRLVHDYQPVKGLDFDQMLEQAEACSTRSEWESLHDPALFGRSSSL